MVGCGISAVGTMETSAQNVPDASTADRVEPSDAANDAPLLDAPEICTTWNARHFTPCAIPAPGPAVTLPAGSTITYDTDLPGFVEDPPADPPALALAQGGAEAVLISVESLTIPAGTTLRAIGARPLVIASWSTISIDGVLDVGSSTADGRIGAGANPTICGVGRAQAGDDETTTGGGSGGGGGGAFGGNGGKGGPGDGLENPGGNGGQKTTIPTIVRGGCAGAASGKAGPDSQVTAATGDDTVTAGGAGGGAIQLSARVSISVGTAGRVRAGGAGGRGAIDGTACGGGGGGSGGFIGFDAPAYGFTTNARIASNGGGGGTSAEFQSPAAAGGGHGGDGRDDATQAAGGTYPNSCALNGPPGAAGATLDGPNANQGTASCGGAGGGGAVGFIVVFGAFTPPVDVVFSPPATIVP